MEEDDWQSAPAWADLRLRTGEGRTGPRDRYRSNVVVPPAAPVLHFLLVLLGGGKAIPSVCIGWQKNVCKAWQCDRHARGFEPCYVYVFFCG